jgi:DNA processing protein
MTPFDAAVLGALGARDRRLLRDILRTLLDRPPADDERALPDRVPGEPLAEWVARCRLPAAEAARVRDEARALSGEADEQLRDAQLKAILAVPLGDDRYPPLLAAIPDPPPVLWIRGEAAHLLRPSIAIVGSRGATAHGLEMARRLAADLAEAGLVIVSGLARGIDSAAHTATLSAGGATIAVLGSGPDRIYPPEHVEMARSISSSGAVVSEFPPGIAPLPRHFPLRNRVISGLSHAVVVVEAPEKSGALITASAAAEQGRDVLVVPGQAAHARNRGGHLLIRDGAKVVETADDILQEVGRPRRSGVAESAPSVGQLPESADFTIDDIAARTGEHPSAVLARLLELELTGQIQRLGCGRFIRCRNARATVGES